MVASRSQSPPHLHATGKSLESPLPSRGIFRRSIRIAFLHQHFLVAFCVLLLPFAALADGPALVSSSKPAEAIGPLTAALEKGTVAAKQGAFAALGALEGEAADKLLAQWLDQLIAGKVAREVRFDLVEAAGKRTSALVKAKLKQYAALQPKDDPFAGFREALYGGDAEAGKKIFMERPEASCTRCHKVKGEGGEVGPDLTGIITRHNREYILESIIYPNKQIAAGFESLLVTMKNGQVYAGLSKAEDANELALNTPEDGIIKLKRSDIKSREKGLSPMPEGLGSILSRQDLRNLVEFVATLKSEAPAPKTESFGAKN